MYTAKLSDIWITWWRYLPYCTQLLLNRCENKQTARHLALSAKEVLLFSGAQTRLKTSGADKSGTAGSVKSEPWQKNKKYKSTKCQQKAGVKPDGVQRCQVTVRYHILSNTLELCDVVCQTDSVAPKLGYLHKPRPSLHMNASHSSHEPPPVQTKSKYTFERVSLAYLFAYYWFMPRHSIIQTQTSSVLDNWNNCTSKCV